MFAFAHNVFLSIRIRSLCGVTVGALIFIRRVRFPNSYYLKDIERYFFFFLPIRTISSRAKGV